MTITVEPNHHKKFKHPNSSNVLIEYPTFFPKDDINGKIIIELNKNKNLEHQGIKISLVGLVEHTKDSSSNTKFFEETLTLSPADTINNEITHLDFSFKPKSEKPYETYKGSSFRVAYYLIGTVVSQSKPVTAKTEIAVLIPQSREAFQKLENPPLRMEIGVKDLIHLVFEINKSNYFLREVIVGKIEFVDVNLIIKQMEIQVVRKENLTFGGAFTNETTVMSRFEICDGTPLKGTNLPIRFYLNGIRSLTPSYQNINNQLSVQYFLHLEFVDSENRIFFKRMEINLTRLNNMNRKEIFLFRKKCN